MDLWELGLSFRGFGCRVKGSRFVIWDLGSGVYDLGFRVWDLGFGVWDLGLGA